MQFNCSSVMTFTVQLSVNNLFIQVALAIVLALGFYGLAIIHYFFEFLGDTWLSQKHFYTMIFIFFFPIIMSSIYTPRLVDSRNRIRNREYFAIWETFFIFSGTITGFIKGLKRFLYGFIFAILSAFNPHKSVCPAPFKT